MSSNARNFFKFCPHCGWRYQGRRQLEVLMCARCRFKFYQNSKPTVSAFLTDKQDRIMLVKRAINPKKGWWDAPGGFLEDGEEPVCGLRREMKEELAITIKDLEFLGIYMDTYRYGYDVQTLNIIYLAKIDSGELRPMDDVGEYRWFTAGQIPWRRLGFPWLKKSLKKWAKKK